MEPCGRMGQDVNKLEAEPEPVVSISATRSPGFVSLPVRDAEVGDITIRRALPQAICQLVGAWCFLDHFGPHEIGAGPGLRVGPHPHTGLQTVTWLFDGEVLHRDSLGSIRLIRPGQLNLMTAGQGIAHSEETPEKHSSHLHGLQFWIALPETDRHISPAFDHFAELPGFAAEGLHITVIVGEAASYRSPARVYSPLVGLELRAQQSGQRRIALNPAFEHGLLVVAGKLSADGRRLENSDLHYFGAGRTHIELYNQSPFCAFLFGGKPFGEEILLWWNFVARDSDEMRIAIDDWKSHSARFGEVRGYDGDRLVAPALKGDLHAPSR